MVMVPCLRKVRLLMRRRKGNDFLLIIVKAQPVAIHLPETTSTRGLPRRLKRLLAMDMFV